MKTLSLALALLGFAASPAVAQSSEAVAEAAAEPVPAPAAEEDSNDEIVVEGEVPKEKRRVCQMQTTTGSIVPKRVCRTVAQVEEDERTARESLEIIKRDRDTRSFIQLSREQGR